MKKVFDLISDEQELVFFYTNWKGEKSTRRVKPFEIFFGQNEWHEEPQWLLKAFDFEKNAHRFFALKDILPI